jgi:hypothetical protein
LGIDFLKKGIEMTVTQAVRDALYQRAGGRCECTMMVCEHHKAGTRCTRSLLVGFWDAHHRSAQGLDNLGNLIAMCATCHKNTRSYGKS